MTVQESFQMAPRLFRRHKASGLEGTIQYDITGPGGGTWHLAVVDENCTFQPGPTPNPNATLTVPAEDWVAFAAGAVTVQAAMSSGRFVIAGDVALFWRLSSLFSD